MKEITLKFNVYDYCELSVSAKEKVKKWLLEGRESFIFTEDVEEELKCLFPNSDLKVQYSLGYCQGDGFNIYGNINAYDVLDIIKKDNFNKYDTLTEKEEKALKNYFELENSFKMPSNRRYSYCMADYFDADNLIDTLEYYNYRNINNSAIEKFEKIVKGLFYDLCKKYEDEGYNYFYEISEEEATEECEANEFLFTEDGKVYFS